MICLGKEGDSGTDLLKLLNVLLSTETGSQDKCQILEEDFHIRMTQTLESEVSLMCNLSKGVEEKGIQKGIQKGLDKGITAMILTLKELQISSDIILEQIREKFDLTEETAKIFSPPMGLPLWMEMSLLSHKESEMHIKLKISIRFRKPKDLHNKETSHPPIKVL